MPTTRPRYTFTDTGHLRELLDRAAASWPRIRDRKALLLALAQAGHDTLSADETRVSTQMRRDRAQAALGQIGELVDPDVLLSDQAWR